MFDTAVIRRLARAEDLALLSGMRAEAACLLTCSAAAFRDYRLTAEAACRREAKAAGDDEVRQTEIAAWLAARGLVTDADRLAALEYRAAQSTCLPHVPVRDALNARRVDQRLVFVSDTTLPGEVVADILRACGYRPPFSVFTSADVRLNKASGRLFGHVLAKLGVAAGQVLHIGDDPISDGERAGQCGLATRLIDRPWPPPEPDAVAARAPLARLAHSVWRSRAAPSADPVLPWDRHAALLLIGFTLFVLDQARRRGIRRVYFLARDGYIPLAIARRLTARQADPPELHYLAASRQATVLPALADDLPSLAAAVADAFQGQALQRVLTPFGFDPPTTADWARTLGLDPAAQVSGDALVQLLFAEAPSALSETLAQRRQTAIAYLAQTGFLAPGPRMIVDVGWRGSTQLALARLAGGPSDEIFGAYLGLWDSALRPGLDAGNAAGYLFSFGHPPAQQAAVRDGYALVELLFSAPHGAVSHFSAAADGAVRQVYAEESRGSVRQRLLARLEADCLMLVDTMDTLLDGAWPATLDPGSALADLLPLLTRPTRRQVAAVNRIPFIQGLDGTDSVVAVNPVPLHELALHPRHALRRIGNSPWRAGAVRASLPWPLPDMRYGDFHYRASKLLRLLRWR